MKTKNFSAASLRRSSAMFDVLVEPFRNDGRGSGRRNGVRRLVMLALVAMALANDMRAARDRNFYYVVLLASYVVRSTSRCWAGARAETQTRVSEIRANFIRISGCK
uniref:Uncharacterized protein n=1 Tax=Minutocellus polymorphus TaxID=265543 RepID=A0A7S0B2K0_9STRA